MLVAASIFILALPLAAQTNTGSISGVVMDEDGGALPGVQVEASGPNLQGVRTVFTDAGGNFRIATLPPGIYNVAYILDGFSPVAEDNVNVRIATDTAREVTMNSGVTDTIVVTGENVVVDTTKSSVDTSVGWELIDSLANNRTFQSVMTMAPGVQVNANNPRVHGASDTDNLYLIDGVDTTDPRVQMWGTAINYDTIQEVQVQTGGMPAEFGRVVGGVVNLVTKSGGNEFHGTARVIQNDVDWVADPDPGTVASTASDETRPSLTLGGPLMQDKFWFFTAYEERDRSQSFIRETGSGTGELEGDVSTYGGHYLSGKLTLQANPSNSLVAYYNEDPIDISDVWARYYLGESVDKRTEGIQQQGGWTGMLNWTGILNPESFVEAKIHSYNGIINVIPQGPVGPEPTALDLVTGWWSGTTLEDYRSDRTRDGVAGAYNRFIDSNMGTHQVKAGIDYLEVKNTTTDIYYPQGNFILTLAGDYYLRYEQYNRPGPLVTTNPYMGLFVQDSWQMDRLTVNMGLRAEQVSLDNNVGTEVLKFDFADQIAPRLGFAYDLNGNSLHGSASRFYDIASDYITAALNENGERTALYIWLGLYGYACPAPDASGHTTSDCWAEIADWANFDGATIDPSLKPTYTDEITLGYDHRISSNMSAGVNFVMREQYDAIEDFDVDDDGIFHIANAATVNGNDTWKKYQGLEFVLRKSAGADRFQFLASYTHAFKDEGYTSDSQLATYGDTSDAIPNRYGDNDTSDLIKFDGSYELPWGSMPTSTIFGLSGNYYSGPMYYPATQLSNGFNRGWLFDGPGVEVGSRWQMDLHVEQQVDIGSRVNAAIYIDFFNLTDNQEPTNRQRSLTAANFGQPTAWQTPQRYQIGAKIEF